jgi:hypothetical protein
MAELKVEPKRGMGWIWVVVVLVVLALVAWLLFARGGADVQTTTTATGALAAAFDVVPVLT